MGPDLREELLEALSSSDVTKTERCLAKIKDGNKLNTYDPATERQNIMHKAIAAPFKNSSDQVKVLELLLNKGGKLDILTGSNRDSVISLALEHKKSDEVLRFLLENGANPDECLMKPYSHFMYHIPGVISTECTALHLFAKIQNRPIEYSFAIIEFSQNPNAALRDGHTPLHVATFHKNPAAVSAFLRHPDINTECRNYLGHTPLAMAVQLLSQEYKRQNGRINWVGEDLCKIIKLLKIAGSTLSQEELQQLTESAGEYRQEVQQSTKEAVGYEQIDLLLQNIDSTIESTTHTPYFRKIEKSPNISRSSVSLTEKQALLLLQWRTMIQYDTALLKLCSIFKHDAIYQLIFKTLLAQPIEKLRAYKKIENQQKEVLDQLPLEVQQKISSCYFDSNGKEFFKDILFLKEALQFECIFYTILNAPSLKEKSGVFYTLPQEILDILLFEYILIDCTKIQPVKKALQDRVKVISEDIHSSNMSSLSISR